MKRVGERCGILFFHVEKCGGTSLLSGSRMRTGLKHCDVISSARNGNVISTNAFSRSAWLYPNADFFTGHCMRPGLKDAYLGILEGRFDRTISITCLRRPIDRILSDYAHAARRGEQLKLAEFARISYKRNYLISFLGEGDKIRASEFLDQLDFVLRAEEINGFVEYLNTQYGFGFIENIRTNEGNVDEAPSCLRVSGGVQVGKYQISKADAQLLAELNEDDLQLYQSTRFWENNSLAQAGTTQKRVKQNATHDLIGRLYRNLIYKPAMQHTFGYVYEQRNAIPHDPDAPFSRMWE